MLNKDSETKGSNTVDLRWVQGKLFNFGCYLTGLMNYDDKEIPCMYNDRTNYSCITHSDFFLTLYHTILTFNDAEK